MIDKFRRLLAQPGVAVLLALLALMLLNWPFLDQAVRQGERFLYVYFFAVWGAAIGVACLISLALGTSEEKEHREDEDA